MADSKVSALSPLGSVDRTTDLLYIVDATGPTSNKMTINSALGFSGGNPVSTSDSQSLTNKTLDNTNTVTLKDTLFTIQDDADTTKQIRFNATDVTTGTTRTFRFPNVSDILVTESATQGLTNKTLTAPTIDQATITRPTLTVDSIAEYTAANGINIDGLLIKDGLLPAGNIQPLNLVAGTGSSWVWQDWTPTWTNLTTGNGTLTYAKYSQIGKAVRFRLRFVLGSTSNVSGVPKFTLPVTAASGIVINDTIDAKAQLNDATGSRWEGWPLFDSTSAVNVFYQDANSVVASTSSTAPFIWTTNDQIMIAGSYEAA